MIDTIVAFMIGFTIGYMVKHYVERKHIKMATVLSIVIIIMWCATIIAEILITGYSTPIYVNVFMGAVVGSQFDIKEMIKK